VGGAIGGAADWVADTASGAWNSVMGVFDKIEEWIDDKVADTLRGVANGVKGLMPDSSVGDIGRGVVDQATEGLITMVTGARKAQKDAEAASIMGATGAATANGANGLGPAAAAARAYVMSKYGITNIGGYSNRNIAGTNTLSDHATGHAMDVMLTPDYNSAAKRAVGNQIAEEFRTRAGTKYVIYYDRIANGGAGWTPYGHPGGGRSDTLQHRDHVHVSFFKKGGILDQMTAAMSGGMNAGMNSGLFDRGGWLQPGMTMAHNKTGQPEAVMPTNLLKNAIRDGLRDLPSSCRDAIERGFRHNSDWIERYWERDYRRDDVNPVSIMVPGTTAPIKMPGSTPGSTNTVPPVTAPVIEQPRTQPAPVIPSGSIGDALLSAFTRLAPELSMALKAGSRTDIVSAGQQVLANDQRLAAIAADISQQIGAPIADISSALRNLVNSAMPTTATPSVVVTALQQQFAAFKQFVSTNTRAGNYTADNRLDNLPEEMEQAFLRAFPDVKRSMSNGIIDVNKTLSTRAADILKYASNMNESDGVALLTALSGVPRVMAEAQKAVTTTNNNAASAPVTIHDGAFQVTVQGGADAATVAQLQELLAQFGDELLHQITGSK